MGIDWTAPFSIAFELFMFGLGWLLVVIVIAFFAFLTYAIIASFFTTIRKQKLRRQREEQTGIITFDKK